MSFECCLSICDNLSFCSAQVKAKYKDDLLIGTEHSKDFTNLPNTSKFMEQLSQDDKVQIVLNDPKFGMLHYLNGIGEKVIKNEILKKEKYGCTDSKHFFIDFFFTNSYFYISMDNLYSLSLVMKLNNIINICPNDSSIGKKAIMFAASLVYFVRSFFLWDNFN